MPLIFLFCLVMLLFVGCKPSSKPGPQPAENGGSKERVDGDIVGTLVPSPRPTATPTPMPTATPIPTPAPTATPSPILVHDDDRVEVIIDPTPVPSPELPEPPPRTQDVVRTELVDRLEKMSSNLKQMFHLLKSVLTHSEYKTAIAPIEEGLRPVTTRIGKTQVELDNDLKTDLNQLLKAIRSSAFTKVSRYYMDTDLHRSKFLEIEKIRASTSKEIEDLLKGKGKSPRKRKPFRQVVNPAVDPYKNPSVDPISDQPVIASSDIQTLLEKLEKAFRDLQYTMRIEDAAKVMGVSIQKLSELKADLQSNPTMNIQNRLTDLVKSLGEVEKLAREKARIMDPTAKELGTRILNIISQLRKLLSH
ncbi:MAG TPA: hypothetical protein PLU50_05910 [Pseudobdellovibrionaceae bacterium]|nr:hypothetical protein [Pseudobdellovibrionaceae bacterium]